MSIEANKELARRWLAVDAAQERQQGEAVDKEFCAPEFIYHEPMGDMNMKSYRQYIDSFAAAFPDFKFTPEDIIAEADKVTVRYKFSGTYKEAFMGIPPTGKKIINDGMAIVKIAEGRIAEAWFAYDTLGFMRQMGAIPG